MGRHRTPDRRAEGGGAEKVYSEKQSGAKTDRAALARLASLVE
jgi:hypothetical protein